MNTSSSIIPQVKQVDSFTDKEGNIFGLEEYQNKYGQMDTRHYLSYNGEIGDMQISLSYWERLKAESK